MNDPKASTPYLEPEGMLPHMGKVTSHVEIRICSYQKREWIPDRQKQFKVFHMLLHPEGHPLSRYLTSQRLRSPLVAGQSTAHGIERVQHVADTDHIH